ncbi:hypothetical protein [Agrobacterium tumefaciens]|nr:hypothetical protein [Agrobacterium tumefaciens]
MAKLQTGLNPEEFVFKLKLLGNIGTELRGCVLHHIWKSVETAPVSMQLR